MNQRQLFLRHLAQTSDAPLLLEIEKGEGCYLYDPSGKKYLDLISGISVSNVGHCHPNVVKAIQEQSAKYMHTMVYGEYVQSPQVELAKFLTDRLPENLNTVYFTNSGTEAAEGAMKLAKRCTGNSEIIYCKHSYHGSSMGSLSVMGDEYFKQNYRPLIPGNTMIRYNVEEDLTAITHATAAVIMETVQAESGITVPEKSYLQAVRKRCDDTCTLLILDEIQTGIGRTGTFFAFEQFGIIPDILLTAKGLGGGMPIGAFISSQKIFSVLQDNPVLGHITTFGGNAVCCAAALATVKTIYDEDLMASVQAKNALLNKLLVHPKILKKTSFGLMMALHFDGYDFNKKIIDACIKKGVITDWFLFNSGALRIAPPLIITEAEIEMACEVVLEGLG